MKFKNYILLYFTFLTIGIFAQYGNEWIDYSKPHFKIEVSSPGIQRVNASVLNGVGLNFVSSDNFQLYRNGKQVPIYINKTGSSVNYIEFYGYGNDGVMDSTVFKDADWQMHDKFSLFSNIAVYFLTFNDVGGNLRINDISNSLTNLPPKEAYYFHTSSEVFANAYSYGEPDYLGSSNDPLYSSLFNKGEGFMGSTAQQVNNSATTKVFNVNTPYKYSSASVNAALKSVVIGWTKNAHHFKIKIGNANINEFTFNDFDQIKSIDLLSNSLISNITPITIEAIQTSTETNRNTVALLEIEYPRLFNFENASFFKFSIEGNNAVQYLELTNIDNQGTQPILYDISNGYKLKALDAVSASTFRYALPAANGKRELILRADNATNYKLVSSLSEFYFKDYTSSLNQGNYIILSHPSLISSSELQAYKNHRQSIPGGSFDVEIVDVNELYDQFAYGIDHHPMAVRNFAQFSKQTWVNKPEHIFIIGKGREYHEYFSNSLIRAACLVPTFGQPGSDNLLLADNDSDVPNISVGRLPVNNASQIDAYLQKVIAYETEQNNSGDPFQTIANKDFMKQILHFGGGSDATQQNKYKNYLLNYENTATDSLWGANIYSVLKTNSNPLQTIQTDFLREKIDNGVSLITFFGHSYAGGFDLSFDEPENYTNTGKYPIYLANGCNAGAIHSGGLSISERFIFVEDKGAIAYLSTTSLSVDVSLNTFSSYFYKNLANPEYTKGIGTIIQKTIEDVETCCGTLPIQMMTPHEMTLNGDPAIRFNQYNEPDYNIETQNVSFSPNVISTSLDSFSIDLEIYNLGKAIHANINIEVARILPNGAEVVVNKIIKAPLYKNMVKLKFPVLEENQGLGLNKFNIYVDNTDLVQNEISETNNYLLNQVELFIGSDDIYPIYPYEFAIVPQQNITLKASTGNTFALAKNYKFQIDTSELFLNSLAETVVNSAGGVVKWTPNIIMNDSTVYYWRVSTESTLNWQYSSFIYIKDEFPGWNQSHYYQWQKDAYSNIYLDTDREFKFVDDVKDVFVQTGVYPNLPYQQIKWELNSALRHNWSMNICSGSGGFGYKNGLSIALIDNLTGLPVSNFNSGDNFGPYGNIHCNNNPNERDIANFQAYGNTPSNHPTPSSPWSQVIIDYLNSVPNDFYVLIYSVNNPNYGAWDASLVNYLNVLGSTVSNSTPGPMILMYQKNNAGFTPVNTLGTSFSDIISEHIPISGVWNTGNIKSTTIGPAVEWGSFQWRYQASEIPTSDNQKVEIYGINNAGNEALLATVANVADTALNFIDAVAYPYLRLKLLSDDLVDRTPTQLDYWRVLFQKAPEGAMNPNLYFETNKDTLAQGDIFKMSIAFENVTPWAMDSVWLKEANQFADNSFEQNYNLYDSLRTFDTLHFIYNNNTLQSKFVGTNSLLLEANPIDYNHQLEQFHFNNFALLNFNVEGDERNPLLDVTFDGVHILDGDIVSAEPTISVQLKDENKYLALDDTSSLDLFIRYLEDGSMRRLSYQSDLIEFYPANNSNLAKDNKALVVIKDKFPKDGTYELIIKAKDKSGNNSSNTDGKLIDFVYYDYKISFEIINKSTITNILNYPNPFTAKTHFVFTLTGSQIPDKFDIKIYTIKGTLVKHISKEELGDIHIGINKTQYTWDGTDDYGDKLANGVYLYRVFTSLGHEEIEHLENQQVDKFFNKGFGKMVFVR